jgi:EAL domain-containing protein (putative c-di-GMP-specific phosphodiesterase class I)
MHSQTKLHRARLAQRLATASPYAALFGSALLIAMLITTMSLTAFERQWIVFLSGVLAAAVFSMMSRNASTRWSLARRTVQLNTARAKLVIETRARIKAEEMLAQALADAQMDIDAAAVAAVMAAPAPEAKTGEPQVHDGLAARLVEALERDEFTLYSQSIVPLGAAGDGATFCEVLLRMNEEEEKLLPPGTFFPVAAENGLLPDIDRWVIRNVLKAAAAHADGSDAVYFVNLAPPTVSESGLAAFVRHELARSKLRGNVLCFEFAEADVIAEPRSYRDLIAALDGSGCRFAVSGFGRHAASVQFLKQLRVSYVKLDGAVALNLTRGAQELARGQALIVAAHAAELQVVAQCVENVATRTLLELMKADFVQGFGIAMPRPMQARRASAPVHPLPRALERAAA